VHEELDLFALETQAPGLPRLQETLVVQRFPPISANISPSSFDMRGKGQGGIPVPGRYEQALQCVPLRSERAVVHTTPHFGGLPPTKPGMYATTHGSGSVRTRRVIFVH